MSRVRLGLILEDVDGFAGDIAHRHVRDDSVKHVTASVDKITWLQSPPEGQSLLLGASYFKLHIQPCIYRDLETCAVNFVQKPIF